MRALPALILAVLAGPLAAQDRVLGSVTADLDRDGRPETFLLLDAGEGVADLVAQGPDGTLRVPDAAWSGAMAGTEPSLALSPAGSLLLRSGNDAIGRDRWSLTVTVARRDGALKVAGLTYAWRDTLDPEAGWGSCDLNLLTGAGTRTGPAGETAIRAAGPAPRLADWSEARLPDWLPAECLG